MLEVAVKNVILQAMLFLAYRDINPVERQAFVTWILIIVNVLLYLAYGLPSTGDPDQYINLQNAWELYGLFSLPNTETSALVTHMFLHGGVAHLVGNMLLLYIFGNNLEDVLGHFRFLLFFLSVGIVGGVVYALTEADSTIPAGGASGAVAGIMGGYLVLFPRAKLRTLLITINFIWPLSIILRLIWKWRFFGYLPILFLTFTIPAWSYLCYWAAVNLFGVWLNDPTANIAYSIHLGGFIAGIILIYFSPKARQWQRHNPNPAPDLEVTSPTALASPTTESTVIGPWDKPKINQSRPTVYSESFPPGPWDKPKKNPSAESHGEVGKSRATLHFEESTNSPLRSDSDKQAKTNESESTAPPEKRYQYRTVQQKHKPPSNESPINRR